MNGLRIFGILSLGLACVGAAHAATLNEQELGGLLGELNEARAALESHQRLVAGKEVCPVEGQMEVSQALLHIDRSRQRILPLLRFLPLEAHRILFASTTFRDFLKERLGDLDRVRELEGALKTKLFLMQEGAWAKEGPEGLARIVRSGVSRSLRRLESPEDLPRIFGSVRIDGPLLCADEGLAPGNCFTLRARADADGWEGTGCPGGALEVCGLGDLVLHGHADRDDYFQGLEVFARGRIPWSARAGDVLKVRVRFVGYGPFFVEKGRIGAPVTERTVELTVTG